MPDMDSVQKKPRKDIKLKIRKSNNKLNKSKLKKRKRRKGLLRMIRKKLSTQHNSLV